MPSHESYVPREAQRPRLHGSSADGSAQISTPWGRQPFHRIPSSVLPSSPFRENCRNPAYHRHVHIRNSMICASFPLPVQKSFPSFYTKEKRNETASEGMYMEQRGSSGRNIIQCFLYLRTILSFFHQEFTLSSHFLPRILVSSKRRQQLISFPLQSKKLIVYIRKELLPREFSFVLCTYKPNPIYRTSQRKRPYKSISSTFLHSRTGKVSIYLYLRFQFSCKRPDCAFTKPFS